MNGSLTVLQVVGLVVACLVAGAALLTLVLSGISAACDPGCSEGTGCGVFGGVLLVGAFAFAIWVLSAA
jgi:hypothetical protein